MQVSGICQFASGRDQIHVTRLPTRNPGSRRMGSICSLAPFPIAVYVALGMTSPVAHIPALRSCKFPPQRQARYSWQLNHLLPRLLEVIPSQLEQNPLSGPSRPPMKHPLRNPQGYKKMAPNPCPPRCELHLENFLVAQLYRECCPSRLVRQPWILSRGVAPIVVGN